MADDTIKVLVTADASELKSGMDEAVGAVEKLQPAAQAASESANDFSESLRNVGEIAAGVFGGLTIERELDRAVDLMKEATTGTYEWAESLENLSYSTGASVTALQKLQSSFAMAGVSSDRIATFTTQLTRRLAEVEASSDGGSKAFVAAMNAIGATRADFSDINGLLLKLSDYMNRVGVNSLQAREVMAEFGSRSSAGMAPALANLRAYEEESTKLGFVLSTDEVEGAAHAQIAINRLELAWQTFLRTAGSGTSSLAESFATGLTAAIFKVQASIELMEVSWEALSSTISGIAGPISDALKTAFGPIFEALDALPKLKTLLEGFTGVGLKPPTTAALGGAGGGIAGPGFSGNAIEDKVAAINASLDSKLAELAKPITTPSAEGGGLGGPGFSPVETAAQAKRIAEQKLAEFRAELADEEAEAGKDINKKIELEQAFVEKVRTIRNLPTKDLIASFATEERAYQSYLEEKQRMALADAANAATVNKASLDLQQAQTKAFYEQQVAAPKLRLAGGDETKLQELADQRAIAVQELAQQETLQDEEQASLMAHLNQVLAILQDSGVKDQQAIATAQANILAAQQTFEAKRIELETKAAAQLAQLDVQYTATATKQMVTLWQSAMEPIARGFDQVVSGVLQGTQSISQAFRRMGEDIALSMVRSGILGLLQGGQQGSMAGGLFGTTGAAGGLNVSSLLGGLFSSLFGGGGGGGGGASGNFFQQIISQAFTSSQPAVSSTFSAAFNSSQGVLSSLFSSIFSSLGPMLGLGGAAGGGGLMSAMSALGPLAMGGLLMFEHGGVVPSAAGGMLTPRGGAGRLAIVHPNEMILNSALTNRVTSAFPGPDQKAGDTHIHNWSISAIDTKGMAQFLKQSRGHFEKMFRDSTRGK